MKQIFCIGIGLGNPQTLTIQAKDAVESCDLLIGANRMLAAFDYHPCATYSSYQTAEICTYITQNPQYQTIGLLFSGDTGFYSGAKAFTEQFSQHAQSKDYQLTHICGISSLSYFCAKLQTPWDDAAILTLHGRETPWLSTIQTHRKTFLLTGGAFPVQTICRTLCEYGLEYAAVSVGSNLSYENESIIHGSAQELAQRDFPQLSVMLIEHNAQPPLVSCGLPDEAFIRGKVPMTKSEVRALVLSKLALRAQDIVYDIGAGTGSIAVEIALQIPNSCVYAIERNPEALDLIAQNKLQFCTQALQIVSGTAPQALVDLPAPTKAFIGGSGGNLREIFTCLLEKNPTVRFVITAISLETLTQTLNFFQELEIPVLDITQASIAKARKMGGYHMMMGQNPVYLITAQRNKETTQ